MSKQTLKEIIEARYGSINNFIHTNYDKIGMSRTYIYKLLYICLIILE